MGFALVRAAREAGFEATLITTTFPSVVADGVEVIDVESAEQMRQAVVSTLRAGDTLVMTAAVADYRPAQAASSKIKKKSDTLTLELVRTADILLEVAALAVRPELFVVGFAAETDDLVPNAVKKLHEKRLDLIVLNDVARPGIGMGGDDNAVTVIDADGIVAEITRRPKIEVARALVDLIAAREPAA
jgi:phosphopantothenoylcysteine decarboxylase/phosphopantothenate--cysteine ligase